MEPGDMLGHMWPRFLPDGRQFLFCTVKETDYNFGIYLGSLDSPDTRLLLSDAAAPGFAPPDYLLFVRAGILMAQRFDFAHARPLTEPHHVADLVGESDAYGANYSVSGNGVLAYKEHARSDSTRLIWRGRDGSPLDTPAENGRYSMIYLSPDEKQASVVQKRDRSTNIWLLHLGTGILSPLTFETGFELALDPIWSPDSSKIVYQIYLGARTRIMMLALRERTPKLLLDDGNANFPDDWSPDGKWILGRSMVGDEMSVFRMAADGSMPPQELLAPTHFSFDSIQFSPDGRWVAYNSDASGGHEVWIARFPSMTDAKQVSNSGGCQPIWRKDGKELFYLSLDGTVMSMPLVPGATLRAEAPRMLFPSKIPVQSNITQYAVASNGQKFLLVESAQDDSPLESREPLHVLTNWQASLRR